jgi:regulator of protease activity HflC (stomatin/prohibitin superfamily)
LALNHETTPFLGREFVHGGDHRQRASVSIILLAVIILPQMIRILREYERGVIFRLGKLLGTKGPGLIFLIPIVDRMVRMDLRVVTIDVARQEVMTRDNVPMTVDAVVYFRVIDPAAAVVRVDDFRATDRPATALLTDDEGNFERA